MIITDISRFLLISLLAVLSLFDMLFLSALFIVQVFVSISDSLFNSCSDGILPDLVSTDNLHKVNAAKGSSDAIALILGPVAGGVIYGIAGILPIFCINALSFALSGIMEWQIRYQKTTRDYEGITIRSFGRRIKQTVQFIAGKPVIRQLFIMGTVMYFIIYPLFDVVFPFIVKKTIGFSSTQMGIIFGFLMGGMLIGNIVTGGLFKKIGTKRLMRYGLVAEIVLIMIVGSSVLPFVMTALGGASIYFFVLLCGLVFIIGFFSTWVLMPVNVNMQKIVPNDMRSRFFSMLNLSTQAAVPVSAMVYGVLLDIADSYMIVFGVGVLFTITALNFLARAHEEIYNPVSAEAEQPALR
jgi:MFS family permease